MGCAVGDAHAGGLLPDGVQRGALRGHDRAAGAVPPCEVQTACAALSPMAKLQAHRPFLSDVSAGRGMSSCGVCFAAASVKMHRVLRLGQGV